MTIYELIATRYSVRQYAPRPVPADALNRILDAARLAPSAANYQPWHFFVVANAETRAAMFPTERQTWIAAAPVVIVACSTPGSAWVRACDRKNHADIDLAIIMDHLTLAATAEGLGTCWICAFDPEIVRAALHLPAGMEPVACTPLGYSQDTPRAKNRKALGEIVTFVP